MSSSGACCKCWGNTGDWFIWSVYTVLQGLSGIMIAGMSLRAIVYGDWMTWYGMALWTTIAASVLVVAWIFSCFRQGHHICAPDTEDARSANLHMYKIARATVVQIALALIWGLSYLTSDEDDRSQFNQNFPDHFYEFTTVKMVATYARWIALFVLTFVLGLFQFDHAFDLYLEQRHIRPLAGQQQLIQTMED